jgi:iron complex transport system ATP-binding protein
MIELEQVCFSYGASPVLKEINTVFRAGEICAVVGPNGCGKTTLVRLLSRLQKPTSGRIRLNGISLEEYSQKELAKTVALLPQGRSVPEIRVEEAVADARFPYLDITRRLSQRDWQAVERALEESGAAAIREKNLQELSGGERQRVYLAMLLAQETPVVLLDEPMTYLDLPHQFVVMKLLQKLRDTGICVVVVLHDLALAMRYCDRILVLENGKIAADGKPEAVAGSEELERIFGVRCISVEMNGEKEYVFCPV